MTQIHVIHGYTASPEENWFPWLKQTADQVGVGLKVLRLDPSETPRLDVWQKQMDEQISGLTEDSIVIAHSLGCIALLHYLSQKLEHHRIKQLVLVAGFNGRLGRLEQVNPFIDAVSINFDLIQKQVEHRVVIYSEGDERVLPKFSLEQAKSLDAEVIQAKHQGHFIDSEGCTELPEVWSVISPYLKQQ